MTPSVLPHLVTGATGFIGGRLLRHLVAAAVPVECLVFSNRAQSPRLSGAENVGTREAASITPAAMRSALADCTYGTVFDLAAAGVQRTVGSQLEMLDGNVVLLAGLLMAVAQNPPSMVVHAGSWSEYARPVPGRPITEDGSLLADSLYGAAKAAATVFGNALARELRIPFVTLRLFNVYGVGEAPHRLIPYLIDRLSRDEPVDLTGGEQVRDFLHVEDVVEALLVASQPANLVPYTVYNVCSGRPASVKEIALAVADAMGKPRHLLRFGRLPYRGDEPRWMVGDNTRFCAATGWRPTRKLEEGIQQMVEAARRSS